MFKDKLSVCFISYEYPPNGGGISTYVKTTAEALKELGNDVYVITSKHPLVEQSIRNSPVTFKLVSLEMDGRFTTLLAKFSRKLHLYGFFFHLIYQYRVLRAYQELASKNKIDIIEASDYLGEGLLVAFFNKFKKPHPVFLLRLHTSQLVLSAYYQIQKDSHYYAHIITEYLSMQLADKLASPGKVLQKITRKYSSKKVDIVRYIVANPEIKHISHTSLKKEIKINFPNRLQDGKGIFTLLEAAKKVISQRSNATFYLIGSDTNSAPGRKSVRAFIYDQIDDFKGKLKITGNLKHKYLHNYYLQSDICVMPSIYDNFPYSALEAMTYAIPLIGSTDTGIEELIENYECGLTFKNGDSESLVAQLIKLIDTLELRKKYGENGQKAIREEFIKDKTASAYQNYLLSIRQ